MSEICELKSKAKPGDMNPNTGSFGYVFYLFFRKAMLYFRIAVSNHLHSLLKKKEIRKSLGTGRLGTSVLLFCVMPCRAVNIFCLPKKFLRHGSDGYGNFIAFY